MKSSKNIVSSAYLATINKSTKLCSSLAHTYMMLCFKLDSNHHSNKAVMIHNLSYFINTFLRHVKGNLANIGKTIANHSFLTTFYRE